MQKQANVQSVDVMFQDKNLTFDDIERLNVKQFSKMSPNKPVFRPSDILDINDS
jgi:hypothetical protein